MLMYSIVRALIFSFVVCLSTVTSMGYICTARLMVNKATKQRLIVLSDYHDETKANIIQRQSLLNYAKKFDVYLLAEDNGYRCDYVGPDGVIAYPSCFQTFLDALVADPIHFDPNARYDGDFSVLDPKADNETSPLLLLTPMAKIYQIKTKTVECRQAEKVSHRNGPISAQQVVQTYDALAERVASYNDGAQCNAFYEQKLKEYKQRRALCSGFFEYLACNNNNLKEAFKDNSYETEVWNAYKKIEFDNNINDYLMQGADLENAQAMAARMQIDPEHGDSLYSMYMMYLHNFLIDSALVHEIATNTLEPIIIAYCGAMHANSIMPVLCKSGFQIEKVWDASSRMGQGALNLDSFFEKITPQLQESMNAKVTSLESHFI